MHLRERFGQMLHLYKIVYMWPNKTLEIYLCSIYIGDLFAAKTQETYLPKVATLALHLVVSEVAGVEVYLRWYCNFKTDAVIACRNIIGQ
jgi:hypothetical protein